MVFAVMVDLNELKVAPAGGVDGCAASIGLNGEQITLRPSITPSRLAYPVFITDEARPGWRSPTASAYAIKAARRLSDVG